jgi:ATP-dependent DNA helicase DinG
MKGIIAEQARLQMKEEIATAGGNEVFFLGRTDENLVVVEVETLARGNRDAVAAILIVASFGDVVLHNHPGGVLTPSQADLEIASLLGNQGVGFYIINNEASQCYQAVAPFAHRHSELLSFPEIERFFSEGGQLAESLPGYEFRPEQLRMAYAVAEVLNEDRIALIEAGTGTGKSLAYLYPSILWAVRNKERIVISTNTINLQEQLTKKDLPFLRKHSGISFKAALVKGRGNYLCLRKLDAAKGERSLFPDEGQAELEAIIEWSAKTGEGCRNDLSFIPRDETWSELCCEADQCSRVRCASYNTCFFYRARREASTADLLVVNHALLMADVALRQQTGYGGSAVLPPFHRLIFDEGHHLEDVATSYFSSTISRQGLLQILGRLQHPRKQQYGVLPRLSSLLSREIPEHLDGLYMELAHIVEGELFPRRLKLLDQVNATLESVALSLRNHMHKGGEKSNDLKLRVTPQVEEGKLWENAAVRVRALEAEIRAYAGLLGAFLKASEKIPDKVQEKFSGAIVDLRGIKNRLESAAQSLHAFAVHDEQVCRWFEVRSGKRGLAVRLCSAPLDVAHSIKTCILDKFRSVVLTSATLAVGNSFQYLSSQTGLDQVDRERVLELLLESPFDYESQALVAIPADLPEPTGTKFENELTQVLLEATTISQGRAFLLFTSFDLLTRMYGRLQGPLAQRGIKSLKQGEMNRHLLLSRFRKEESAVLFGTDSFWEGVDVKGRALELVVITRLPFRVPTEPIIQARTEQMATHGHDPFMEYTVPQAVIKFKQGFGRLIRSREDRGSVLICDSRVLSKPYGRFFLASLPKVALSQGPAQEVLADLKKFVSRHSASASEQPR